MAVPDGVIEIGAFAFDSCGFTSIALPESVTKIESATFMSCSALNSVDVPGGVTSIGTYAFACCRGLASVVLPENVTKIEKHAFAGCSSLVVVTLHCHLPVEVAACAFDKCDHLSLVVAPRASGLVGAVLGGETVVEDTNANRRRALDLQYWQIPTHWLCSRARRDWVLAVLIVADRLRGGPLALPSEMWYAILGAVRRCELGTRPVRAYIRL
jgi:hypothetical protein